MKKPSLHCTASIIGSLVLSAAFLLGGCRPPASLSGRGNPASDLRTELVDLQFELLDLGGAVDLHPPPDLTTVPPDLVTPHDLTPIDDGPPVVTLTKIGNPTWMPMDCQLIAALVGRSKAGSPEAFSLLQALLPYHQHDVMDNLIGPRTSHAPPYDGELSAGVAALGITSHRVFMAADWIAPRGIMFVCMMVPSAGAPMGSSPDFASGPIMPNNLFFMPSSGDLYRSGISVGTHFVGNWPPLSALNPPLPQDGWSHMPFDWWDSTDYRPDLGAGSYRYVFQVVDALGNGWVISVPFTVL